MHANPFLETAARAVDRLASPFVFPWPMPGRLDAWITLSNFEEWRELLLELRLRRTVPEIVAAKFERSHKLYLLAWVDCQRPQAAKESRVTKR